MFCSTTPRFPGRRETTTRAIPPDRCTAALLRAIVVCVLVVVGVAATFGVAVGEPLTATSAQDPAAGEASLALDRPAPRLIVRAESLLANGGHTATLEAMNPVRTLQKEPDLVLQGDFDSRYAQVAYTAGRTETAICRAAW